MFICSTFQATCVSKYFPKFHKCLYKKDHPGALPSLFLNYLDLLQYLKSDSVKFCTSIQRFYFSTLYTTIPHSQLKDRIKKLIHQCFVKQNGNQRNKYLVLGKKKSYFVREQTACANKYSEGDID